MIKELSILQSFLLYLICIGISVFGVFLSERMQNKYANIFIKVVSCFILILLFSFRYDVGTDFLSYNGLFNGLRVISWDNINANSFKAYEFGFRFLSKFLCNIGSNKFVFGFFSSLNFLIFFIIIHKLNLKNKTLSYFVYLNIYYFSSFNILRQVIAIHFCVLGLTYLIKDNKTFSFVFFVILGFLFHKSSIIFFLCYLLWKVYKNKYSQLKKSFLFFIIILLLISWQSIIPLIPYLDKYTYLLIKQNYENKDILLNFMYVILFYLLRKKLNRKDKYVNFYCGLLVIILLINFSGFYTPYLKRLGNYFSFSLIPLISLLPDIFAKKDKKYIYVIIGIFYFLLFILMYLILGQSDLFPYKFY